MSRLFITLISFILMSIHLNVNASTPQNTESNSTNSTENIATPLLHSELSILDRPLIERYILDELKSLRMEQQDLERRLTVDITDRELEVADKSLNYANVTVTYFFYIIAGKMPLEII